MCLPAVIAPIASFMSANATLLSVAGMGMQAVGAYQQAQGAKAAAKYEASVASANAKVAEFKAQDAQDRAQVDAENLGRQIAATRGKQKAAMAANGLDLSSGTPQSILDATDFYGLQDQTTLATNANREAAGYRTQGANYQAEASMQRSRASSISPFTSMATSLLTSAGTLSDKWTAKNPAPAFGSGSAWSFAK